MCFTENAVYKIMGTGSVHFMNDIKIYLSDTVRISLSLFELIVLLLIITLMITIAIYLIILWFGSGKKIRIKVIDKRVSKYESFNTNRARMTESANYIIKCVYLDSREPQKVHTLNCESDLIYKALKNGKIYTVNIKLMHIFKVHSENNLTKKRKKRR